MAMTLGEYLTGTTPTGTTTNERGGKQSDEPYRFDLMDAETMLRVAQVLHEGAAKYGENNWRLIDAEDHINHAILHFYKWMVGDRSEDHLTHATCRAMFAKATEHA
jgi:hypothetical protein